MRALATKGKVKTYTRNMETQQTTPKTKIAAACAGRAAGPGNRAGRRGRRRCGELSGADGKVRGGAGQRAGEGVGGDKREDCGDAAGLAKGSSTCHGVGWWVSGAAAAEGTGDGEDQWADAGSRCCTGCRGRAGGQGPRGGGTTPPRSRRPDCCRRRRLRHAEVSARVAHSFLRSRP